MAFSIFGDSVKKKLKEAAKTANKQAVVLIGQIEKLLKEMAPLEIEMSKKLELYRKEIQVFESKSKLKWDEVAGPQMKGKPPGLWESHYISLCADKGWAPYLVAKSKFDEKERELKILEKKIDDATEREQAAIGALADYVEKHVSAKEKMSSTDYKNWKKSYEALAGELKKGKEFSILDVD
ncbi:MAG: hypothetical protein JNM56_33210 [Planctomycetia bacterium]|nr:hypothetical protein [Planctomycetia bacterium]